MYELIFLTGSYVDTIRLRDSLEYLLTTLGVQRNA
jgi:hypothetical protein